MGIIESRINKAVVECMKDIENKLLTEYRAKQEANQGMLLAKVQEFEVLIVKSVKDEVKKQLKNIKKK